MALLFFPRGGSAQVARYMARALPRAGWDVRLLSGSLGALGDATNAETFFSGIDVRAVDYSASREAPDPLAADPPFHPSFEDRPGAPDRVFARVDDAVYEHLVAFWERALRSGRAGVSGCARGGAPARHRGADAEPDRCRPARELGPRRRMGRAHARLGAALRAAAGALAGRRRARAGAAGRGSGESGSGSQRLRPPPVRPPAPARPGSDLALALVAGGGAARLGRER